MYLGIHWLVDVLAGAVLAAGCVAASLWLSRGRSRESPLLRDAGTWQTVRRVLRR
jgi:membrane-associated phospholipid phosphatase